MKKLLLALFLINGVFNITFTKTNYISIEKTDDMKALSLATKKVVDDHFTTESILKIVFLTILLNKYHYIPNDDKDPSNPVTEFDNLFDSFLKLLTLAEKTINENFYKNQ